MLMKEKYDMVCKIQSMLRMKIDEFSKIKNQHKTTSSKS